jgi:hypothetical protein
MDSIKMSLFEIGLGGVDWIGLAQDRYSWIDIVNTVMKFGFYKMLGNNRVVTQLVATGVVLSSTELVSELDVPYKLINLNVAHAI